MAQQLHFVYLVRYVEHGRIKYYRGETVDLQRRKREHQKGYKPWEGDQFDAMRSITSYETLAEAMAWERRVGNIDHEAKVSLWNSGVDVA